MSINWQEEPESGNDPCPLSERTKFVYGTWNRRDQCQSYARHADHLSFFSSSTQTSTAWALWNLKPRKVISLQICVFFSLVYMIAKAAKKEKRYTFVASSFFYIHIWYEPMVCARCQAQIRKYNLWLLDSSSKVKPLVSVLRFTRLTYQIYAWHAAASISSSHSINVTKTITTSCGMFVRWKAMRKAKKSGNKNVKAYETFWNDDAEWTTTRKNHIHVRALAVQKQPCTQIENLQQENRTRTHTSNTYYNFIILMHLTWNNAAWRACFVKCRVEQVRI